MKKEQRISPKELSDSDLRKASGTEPGDFHDLSIDTEVLTNNSPSPCNNNNISPSESKAHSLSPEEPL